MFIICLWEGYNNLGNTSAFPKWDSRLLWVMHGRNMVLFLCPEIIIFLWWLRHISLLQKRPKRALYQRPK